MSVWKLNPPMIGINFKPKGLVMILLKSLNLHSKPFWRFLELGTKFGANHHRFLLSRFPFSVIYQVYSDNLYVVAIMHNSKNPGYRLKRG